MSSVKDTVERRPSSGKKKLVLRLAVVGIVGLLGLGVLYGLSELLSVLTRNSDTNDVFTEAAELPPELIEAVTWLPDAEGLPRQMEPLTRVDVTAAWLRAWAQIPIVAETGDVTGLEVYFSNSALRGMLDAAPDWRDRPSWQIGHEMQLTFYSEDGQVIGLTSTKSRFLRTERFDDERRYFDANESYEAVLLLEDGNWRIQHWVRRAAEGVWSTEDFPRASGGTADVSDLSVVSLAIPGFSEPGEFDIAATTSQFDDAAAAGFAAARIPVDFSLVGGREVSEEGRALVATVAQLADRANVKIIPSFFAGRTDHVPAVWDGDVRHVLSLISEFEQRSGNDIVMYELAHLPDLDLNDRVNPDLIEAWVAHLGRQVREVDDETPIFITWSSRSAAASALVHGDFVAFAEPAAGRTIRSADPGTAMIIAGPGADGSHVVLVDTQAELEELAVLPGPKLTDRLPVRLGVVVVLFFVVNRVVRFLAARLRAWRGPGDPDNAGEILYPVEQATFPDDERGAA